jgi:predicted nucleic acid-binding protein
VHKKKSVGVKLSPDDVLRAMLSTPAPKKRKPAVGRKARELIWKYGLRPKDSIHVATALLDHVPVLHAFDNACSNLTVDSQD